MHTIHTKENQFYVLTPFIDSLQQYNALRKCGKNLVVRNI